MKLCAQDVQGSAGRGAGRRHAADRRLRRASQDDRPAPRGGGRTGARRREPAPAPIARTAAEARPQGTRATEAGADDESASSRRPPTISPPSRSTSTPPRTATPAARSPTGSCPTRDSPARGVRQQLPPGLRRARTATASRSPSTGAPGSTEGEARRRGLVPGPRRAGHPRRRPQRRTPARRPHLRHRHLRLHGRARPARPGQGVPRHPDRPAARRRLGRPRHLQRRGRDRAADDPARRQPRPDPRRRSTSLEPTDSTNVEAGVQHRLRRRPSRAARGRHQPRRPALRRPRQHRRDRRRRHPRPHRRRPPRARHHPLRRRRRQRLRRRADGAARRQGRRPHHVRLRRASRPARSSSTSSRRTSNCAPATPRRRSPSTRRPSSSSGSSATRTAQVADEDFRDDRVDGGEVGPGHTVTALYAVRLRPGADGHVATATRALARPRGPGRRTRRRARSRPTRSTARCGTAPRTRLQVTAVAAYFAESLRGGSLPGAPGLGELADGPEAGGLDGGQLGARSWPTRSGRRSGWD